jgi:uncharacterized protein involved in exopolysaccharide biosynthesis
VDQLAPDYLATQVDILRSRRVVLQVIKDLGLASDPAQQLAFQKNGGPSFEDFLVATVSAAVSVAPVSTSRVISLTYSARDPVFAAAAVNAYARAYQDTTLQLQAEPARQSVRSYEAQAKAVQDQLGRVQQELSARERALAVTSDTDQTDADINRLNSLSSQLAAAQAAAATAGARASNGALPDTIASPVVQSIQTDLAKLEAQRAQLASYAGPNNIDLIQLDRQIAGLRGQLSQQRALVSRSATDTAVQGASSVAQLSQAVAAQRARAITARANRDEVALLKGQITNLNQTYEQIMTRRAQLGILSEGSQTNVSILSRATPPVKPAWPRPLIMLALGIVLGGICGMIFAIAAELIDQRLRRADDIEAWLGVPNLGIIRRGIARPSKPSLARTIRRFLPRPEGSH